MYFFCLYVQYVECLIGGVPRMGPRVPFALLPLGIFIPTKYLEQLLLELKEIAARKGWNTVNEDTRHSDIKMSFLKIH